MKSIVFIDEVSICRLYLFINFQNSSGMQSVNSQYYKNLLYCQPETTERVVSCFSRLLNLVDEQCQC